MSGIILPDSVVARQRLERLESRHGELRAFDAALKQIDPKLSLIKASESADEPGLTPGFWHIKRDNEQVMPSYLPLKSPDGGFMEPHSGFLTWLQGCDLQRPGALDDLRRREAEIERNRLKAVEDLKADRMAEFAERYKAYDSPGVSMANRGRGWSAKAGGRKAA